MKSALFGGLELNLSRWNAAFNLSKCVFRKGVDLNLEIKLIYQKSIKSCILVLYTPIILNMHYVIPQMPSFAESN